MSSYYSRVAECHGGDYDAPSGFNMRIQMQVRQSVLRFLNPMSRNVIEVGCGSGEVSHLIARKLSHARILGIDFSDEMVRLATQRFATDRLHFQKGSLLHLPCDDSSVDAAVCVNVLHHLLAQDVKRAIAELCRVSRRQVIVEIKNNLSPYHVIKKVRMWRSMKMQISGCNTFTLHRLFHHHGFRITEVWSWGPTLIAPIQCLCAERVTSL